MLCHTCCHGQKKMIFMIHIDDYWCMSYDSGMLMLLMVMSQTKRGSITLMSYFLGKNFHGEVVARPSAHQELCSWIEMVSCPLAHSDVAFLLWLCIKPAMPRLYMMTRGMGNSSFFFPMLEVSGGEMCWKWLPNSDNSGCARNARWIDGSRSCHPDAVGSDHRRSGIWSYVEVMLSTWCHCHTLICSDCKGLPQFENALFVGGPLKACD